MKKLLALVTLCGLGAMAATPVMADDDRRGRDDRRYERHHEDRHYSRYSVRESRPERRYERRYDDRRRYAPRYVEDGRYCDDYRHYRGVHYHVSPRDYYRAGYPRDAYRYYGRSGVDATLVVTLPLF